MKSVEFAPVTLPDIRDSASTPYGFVVDRIWDNPGVVVARRPHWPDAMHVLVLPCKDLDEEAERNGNVDAVRFWVFFDDEVEYVPTDEDMLADDWEVEILPGNDDDEGGAFVLV